MEKEKEKEKERASEGSAAPVREAKGRATARVQRASEGSQGAR